MQLGLPKELLVDYAAQKSTFFRHQEELCHYLGLKKFDQQEEVVLKSYLFHQALQIQSSESLLIKATDFLREQGFLNPSEDTIVRLIQTQREKARTHIYDKIASELTPELKQNLDNLLVVTPETYSKLYQIKDVPKKPSTKAMKLLSEKLVLIEQTGVLSLKLEWLNNNYK